MKNIKNLLFYCLVIGGFSVLIYLIASQGALLETGRLAGSKMANGGSGWDHFKEGLRHNLAYPLGVLLLQIITIILVARLFSYIFKKIGQPSVIGEIVAGIVLGPSLAGAYFPEFSSFIFPATSLPNLGIMSQVGLILFMFVVGMELDLKILRNKAHEAVVISHASIIFPFALGVVLAYFIYQTTAPDKVNFLSYSLFIGISMSITAFPVLARIVQERGLSKTRLGSIAITCAAADDITAWCILAAVIAVVKAGSLASAGYTIILATIYVVAMLKLVRPFLKRIGELYSSKESLSKPIVGIFFVVLLISAWSTEIIGIHALFGAFMAGVIMPPNVNFRNIFIEKVEDIALVLLLPLFFVFTGLRTQIGLLNEPGLWELCGIVVLVAVTGKFAGSALAARFVGQNWHSSLTIGALMNTRGLMELVALNIGYDLGVLSPQMFAILVLMALVTTFITGPSLDLINKFFSPGEEEQPSLSGRSSKYNVLLSFGSPHTGRQLVKIAHSLTCRSKDSSVITALHLSPANELNLFNESEYESESFKLIREEAQKLDQAFTPVFRPVQDINEEIASIANNGDYDLLLVGAGKSVYEGTILGKILGFTTRVIKPDVIYDALRGKDRLFSTGTFEERVQHILKTIRIPTGIVIDKDFRGLKRVIVPFFSLSDSFLLVYIQKFIQNAGAAVTILDAWETVKVHIELKEAIEAIEQTAPGKISFYEDKSVGKKLLEQHDLMLISAGSWEKVIETRSAWLSETPTVLIIKP
ncbi:cation:proton antiporter domain-containing protein [Pararcticibacter amylolyticus]|uniref:Cation/H(+) antiporter n=1 Tax=Pararcticibacter amylolyticus TaxID=2173175 RepID=A0A2U2PM57_9SPHI|nr:cation:proton antiporter [Pararcticibacter amylolyticus]PWG82269.1 cation/H(+) antiporter [Pararcticibacter amylolyticus]